MKVTSDRQLFDAIELELVNRVLRVRRSREHPAFFSHFVRCVDSRSGEIFEFQMLSPEEAESIGVQSRQAYLGETSWIDLLLEVDYVRQKKSAIEATNRDWGWQRGYLEWALENDQTITLKGRQLGVTWVWSLIALWYLLFRPGSDVLIYSIKEEDAVEVIGRIWDMWESLPVYFRERIQVIKPTRGVRPSTHIEFRHPDGRVSSATGMAATTSAGHGRSAALIIFDEASRQKYARELWKAVIPASGDKGGKIGVVSTANGMSDGKGMGNFFHELWEGAGYASYPRLAKLFLGWWLHPDRDQDWYDKVSLDESSKAEQYPNNPEEAFLLSGSPFFSTLSLRYYAERPAPLLYTADFWIPPEDPSKARLRRGEGPLEVFEEPQEGGKYAIGADVATGTGMDFSVAAVINLNTGHPCAELYMKAGYQEFTDRLHFLGLWFNKAWLAVETGGGYGDTVIAYLRDGLKGRRPYSKIYRHSAYDRAGHHQTEKLGFPMNSKTRPKVIDELREWINDQLFPYLTPGLLSEAKHFVHRETRPSPRAADGTNDDRVMAWAIALELYSQYGEHEHDRKKKVRANLKSRQPQRLYPWKYD